MVTDICKNCRYWLKTYCAFKKDTTPDSERCREFFLPRTEVKVPVIIGFEPKKEVVVKKRKNKK